MATSAGIGPISHRPRWSPTAWTRLFPFDAAIGQFTTMLYGVLDAVTGEFRYVSAGHPGPVHLPAGAGPVILEGQGLPIGLAEDAYEEQSVRLAAGGPALPLLGRRPGGNGPSSASSSAMLDSGRQSAGSGSSHSRKASRPC